MSVIEKEFTPEELELIKGNILPKMFEISDLDFYCPIWERVKEKIPEEYVAYLLPPPFPIKEDCPTALRSRLLNLKNTLGQIKLTEEVL